MPVQWYLSNLDMCRPGKKLAFESFPGKQVFLDKIHLAKDEIFRIDAIKWYLIKVISGLEGFDEIDLD